MKSAYLIINGKKTGLVQIREAVTSLRNEGFDLHVRVTWEYGDGLRYVQEAYNMGADLVIAGGGDGTVNEISHGLVRLDKKVIPVMGILPLGTANDFASACKIPTEPYSALKLALTGESKAIDMVKINDRYMINVASGGFGAAVTAETPTELKNFLAGGAYTIMGLIKLLKFTSYPVKLSSDNWEFQGDAIIAAVCNGRQAGGGQILASNGYINDGIFDILLVKAFPIFAIDQVINEFNKPSSSGEYVVSAQGTWLETFSDEPSPVNLDGEPIREKNLRFDILPERIKLVAPKDCPCLL